MKTKKRFITALILIIVAAIAVTVICLSDYETKDPSATQKTMLQYSYQNLTFDKPENEDYECEVSNNSNKYIKVESNNEGEYYWLTVTSNKATKKREKPIITVYQEKGGKKTVIKKFQITVKPAYRIKMENKKINIGTEKEIVLNNPYEKDYRLEYNKKIIDIRQNLYDGDYEYHTLIGLKKGKTKVKAYLEGTKKYIGSFTVKVGDYGAYIKEDYINTEICYNKHIDTCDLINGHLNLSEAIENYHNNAVYSVDSSNAELIGSKIVPYDSFYTDINSKFAVIYSKKTGSETLNVYEKRGKGKKKKIGTIKLNVRQAKDSEVFDSYREFDNDGIFYENFMSPGDSYDLKSAVVERYLNLGDKKYHFKENEYAFTAKSTRPEIVSVDENGVCHCHAVDYNSNGPSHEIKYEIRFEDGSVSSGSGAFDVVDEDFWE